MTTNRRSLFRRGRRGLPPPPVAKTAPPGPQAGRPTPGARGRPTPGNDGNGPALAGAIRWLLRFLEEYGEPLDVADVLGAGRIAGHTEPDIRRAARVIAVEQRDDGATRWSLPTDDARAGRQRTDSRSRADARQGSTRVVEQTPTRGLSVPVGDADPYGRHQEHVTVYGPQEASHWAADAWHPA